MQNSKLVKYHRHSEGVKRLWESPAVSLMRYKGDCHEPNGSRNDRMFFSTAKLAKN